MEKIAELKSRSFQQQGNWSVQRMPEQQNRFGITEAIGAFLVADTAAAAGTAAAVDIGTDAALAAGVSETALVTAPAIAGGIGAADIAGLAGAGLGLDAALSTPSLAASAPAAAGAGATGGGIGQPTSTATPTLGTAPVDTSSTLTALGATPSTPTVAAPAISPGGASALTTPSAAALPGPATGVAGGGSSAVSGGGLGGGGLGTGGLTPDLTSTATGGAGLSGGATAAPAAGTVGGGAGAAGVSPAAITPTAFDTSSLALPTVPAGSDGAGGILSALGINSTKDAIQLGGGVLGGVNALSGIIGANQTQSQVDAALKGITAAQGTQAQATTNLNNTLTGTLAPQAASEASSASTLEGYLSSGTLPPGAQTAIDQATASAKASIKSKYASLGLSGSTMETQDLNSVDMQAASQVVTLATNLYNTGVSQTGLANQLYTAIMQGQGDILSADTNVIGQDTGVIGALSANNNSANAAVTNYAAALSKTA